jgi:predicted DNA-binding antitoxin AbrB/MazE fold protein
MLETIETIYENGTFKPLHPVDLPEGTPVQVSTKLTLRPSAAEAQRQAVREVLTHLGDALSVGTPRLQAQGNDEILCFDVFRSATHELRGELRLHPETGEVLAWLPAPSC